MSKPFQFKQFSVDQDQCAMKIGTDGVLLGAWVSIDNKPKNVLDIGSGTGILSLMLAQRSGAEVIEAIEIDDEAYEQSVVNFENSPWGDRLFCYHAGFLEFVEEIDEVYDIIISNPPFFSEQYKSADEQRDLARFQDALPFEHLLFGVSRMLSENGEASFVIPYSEEERFIAIAEHFQLLPKRITHVKGTVDSKIKRSLLCFSFQEMSVEQTTIIIEIERHQYTEEYIALTKNFYLKM